MKITKTLKEIVEKGFQAKINQLKESMEKETLNAKNSFLDELENDEEVQALYDLEKKLSAKYENKLKEHTHLKFRSRYSSTNNNSNFFRQERSAESNIQQKSYDDFPEYVKALNKLQQEQNELILTLEYEKDSAKLIEILTKYGISL